MREALDSGDDEDVFGRGLERDAERERGKENEDGSFHKCSLDKWQTRKRGARFKFDSKRAGKSGKNT